MANSYTNKKGQTYYLHSKEILSSKNKKPRTIRFFSKVAEGAIDIPDTHFATESERSGLPFLKKKQPAESKPEPDPEAK